MLASPRFPTLIFASGKEEAKTVYQTAWHSMCRVGLAKLQSVQNDQ